MSNNTLEDLNGVTIIKRSGREEPFNIEKLRKVLMWAANDKEIFVNNILENLHLKIKNTMHITTLYDTLIDTVTSKISSLYPIYDEIAKKLYLLKIYKEVAGMKVADFYPNLKKFLQKGIEVKLFDEELINTFTENELDRLHSAIKIERDFLFSYKGLYIFFKKYCSSHNGKKFELPQIVYMRAAMHGFVNDTSKNRIDKIIDFYNMLSTHLITLGTPALMHGLHRRPQLASCVLNTPADDTWSLNQTDANCATYSKFSGGIAWDASQIRATGDPIYGNSGTSDGPIPFIRRLEQTISSFNQQGCLAKDSLVEVIEYVELTTGERLYFRRESVKFPYIVNKDLEDFIDANLKSFTFYNGVTITEEDYKKIWIQRLKNVPREEIIAQYPGLSLNLYKHYIVKSMLKCDKSSLKNFVPIPFYDNYLIHRDGTVVDKSLSSLSSRRTNRKGYVMLFLDNTAGCSLHRLMYSAFVGEIPNNYTVDHIDGNKLNNSVDNLQLLTAIDNQKKFLQDLIKSAPNGLKSHYRKLRLRRHLKYGYKLNGYRTNDDTEIKEIKTIEIPIYKVRVRDYIKCYDKVTKKVEYNEVQGHYEFTIPVERQYELIFSNGSKLITSDHHPIFYLDEYNNVKEKRTDEMKVGDLCIDEFGNNTTLIAVNRPSVPVVFYDLTVNKNNNYFAKHMDSETNGTKVLVHNTRPGSSVVTFPWWHMDVLDMIMLKDSGGSEDTRARKLVYSMTFNQELINRVIDDDYVTLFSPRETSNLYKTSNYEFQKWYESYEKEGNIRKSKVKARELMFKYFKVRKETGNLYAFFADNVNKLNMLKRHINASNLCCTVYGTKLKTEKGDIPIGDLAGQTVKVWNGSNWSTSLVVETTKDYSKIEPGTKEYDLNQIWRVHYLDGTFTDFTGYHRFDILTKDGPKIKRTLELKRDDVINLPLDVEESERLGVKINTIIDFIEPLHKFERTFCAIEPDMHKIVLDGVLTMNCEVLVPSFPSELESEEYVINEKGEYEIIQKKKSGEVGICNLVSINVMRWAELNNKEKDKYMKILLERCDNVIDSQFYPVKEGEISNKKNRPIGIGINNYAQYLASLSTLFTDEKAKEVTFDLMDDIYSRVYKISADLAKERGAFSSVKDTYWLEDDNLPMLKFVKHFSHTFDETVSKKVEKTMKKWKNISRHIKNCGGTRFSLHAAIAPTACQTLDTVIRYKGNKVKFKDYLEKNGINTKEIEEKGEPGWFEFKTPDTIDTRYGERTTNRVWFNGLQTVYKVMISIPGIEVPVEIGHFTGNHKLLVGSGKEEPTWVEVANISHYNTYCYKEVDGEMIKCPIHNISEMEEKEYTWDIEVPEIHEYLLGEGIITHNTSGKAISATEGVEPIFKLQYMEEGTQVLPAIAPNIEKYGKYYQTCFDIPTTTIIDLAAIRQMFLDQAQSVNFYYEDNESFNDLFRDLVYAIYKGMKTLYYMRSSKRVMNEVCEACGS